MAPKEDALAQSMAVLEAGLSKWFEEQGIKTDQATRRNRSATSVVQARLT